MAHIKWDKAILFIFICIPLTLIIWCLKYCCRDENEDTTARPRRSLPRCWLGNQNQSASYLPSYSPRQSQIGFDINKPTGSTPYRPLHLSTSLRNEAPYPTETAAPYPLSDAIPQPSNRGTHPVAPYRLSNISPMPLPPLADKPPSYAEATQNK